MLEKEEVYQYYHRVPACQATSAEAQDCICWHDEGTGIYAGVNRRNPSRSLSWRIKPESRVFSEKSSEAGFKVGDKVKSPAKGEGEVIRVITNSLQPLYQIYPVIVLFPSGESYYTPDGYWSGQRLEEQRIAKIVAKKEDILKKINSKEKLNLFKTFLHDIEEKESALVKWEFVDWALTTGIWAIESPKRIRTTLGGYNHLIFFVSSSSCKLCSLYWEDSEGDSNCPNCPLRPFSGFNCEDVWGDWRETRKPMLKAIKDMLLSYALDSEEILQRNLELLNEKLTVK